MQMFETVKSTLFSKLSELEQRSSEFVMRPGHDFTRKRKLSFKAMIQLMLTMEGASLGKELFEWSHFNQDTVSVSAFSQQRSKIRHEAFRWLFDEFQTAFPASETFDGYRLLACDGTKINTPTDPNDEKSCFGKVNKNFNLYQMTALYNLCSRRYEDAVIKPGKESGECEPLITMLGRDRSDVKTIYIGDRRYESYNVFAHIEQKGRFYLIRVKDKDSNGIVGRSSIPQTNEFDIECQFILTRKMTNEIKTQREQYRILNSQNGFDFIERYSDREYPMSFRIIRILVREGKYECLITNLPEKEFSAQRIKELYGMRWGIETSFRLLKYGVCLTGFHGKKVEYIKQEIYARLLLYNFSALITNHVVIPQKSQKYVYQPNYTAAIRICRYYLREQHDISPPDVEILISKHLLPVRKQRMAPRDVRAQRAKSFVYR